VIEACAAMRQTSIPVIARAALGGAVRSSLIEDLHPHLRRAVDLGRKSLKEKFLGTFRCQTY
jgi:hypothetical protein